MFYFCNIHFFIISILENTLKSTVMQIEQALINDRLRVSKLS